MLDLAYVGLICIFFSVYGWSLYNLPILAAGVRHLRRSKRGSADRASEEKTLPVVSIVVPVKNEERVIGRLLDALVRLSYPADKKEIVIVEDGFVLSKCFKLQTGIYGSIVIGILGDRGC